MQKRAGGDIWTDMPPAASAAAAPSVSRPLCKKARKKARAMASTLQRPHGAATCQRPITSLAGAVAAGNGRAGD